MWFISDSMFDSSLVEGELFVICHLSFSICH